jgi:hypothetical protein
MSIFWRLVFPSFFKALYHGIEHSSRVRGEHILGRLEYGIWLQEWTVCMNENGWETMIVYVRE